MVVQPRRPSHSRPTRFNLHRARPARASPAPQDISDPDADYRAEEAHAPTSDELELHQRLRRRRNSLPSLLIVGLAALALAGGLVLVTSGLDGTKSSPSSVATNNSGPPRALDPSSSGTPTTPAPAEPPTEPPRI